MEGEPRKLAFKRLLLNLSENINERDFKNMKFLCDKYISKSRMEKISYVIELFDELISRQVIYFDKTDQLRILIEKCTDKKLELIQMIDQYEKNEYDQVDFKATSTTDPSTQDGEDQRSPRVEIRRPDLKQEIKLLVDNLGNKWTFFIRGLDVPEPELDLKRQQNSSNIKEAIYACFYYWLSEMANNKTKEEIIDVWIKTLEMIERNDLIEKLKSLS